MSLSRASILTDETTRALLGQLHAEGTRHARLLAVTLDRHVPLLVEFRVSAAKVLTFGVGVGAALITAYRLGTCVFPIKRTLMLIAVFELSPNDVTGV